MPSIPLDLVVGVKQGTIADEIKKLLDLAEKGNIPLTLGVDGSQLSGITSQVAALRTQPLFDLVSTKSGLSEISKALDEIARKASRIQLNINGSSKSSSGGASGSANPISGLGLPTANDATEIAKGMDKIQKATEGASRSLANLAAVKNVDLGKLIGGTNTQALDEYLTKLDKVKQKLIETSQFQAKQLITGDIGSTSQITRLANNSISRGVDVGSLKASTPEVAAYLGKVNESKQNIEATPFAQAQALIIASQQSAKEAIKRAADASKQAAKEAADAEKLANKQKAEIDKIVAKFEKQSFGGELTGQLFGGQTGRIAERVKAAEELAASKNVPGLFGALTASIGNQQTSGSLPSLFQPSNLKQPVIAAQVARGAIFGGTPGFVGGLIGGATPFGQAGALVGAQLVQAAEHLLDPVLKAVEQKTEEYRDSGQALAQSILSIQSVRQATTQVVGFDGRPSTNIAASIALQERSAVGIQTAARAQLLPLGIGGQTEATFVRGVVSALAQRGITANASQTANISRALAGVIQTQRPQLLENPALLNRDLQDVLSGLPQAKRTILGSLLRDSLPDLAKASDAAGIEKALQSKQVFADVAGASTNIVAVQHRLQGAQEAINTAGGQKFLEAQKPSLQFETSIANLDVIKKANEDFGELTGAVEGVTRSFGAISNLAVASSFEAIVDASKPLVALLDNLNVAKLFDFSGSLGKFQDHINRTVATTAQATPKTEINRLIESTGLKDKIDKFQTDASSSPEAQLSAIQRIQDRFAARIENGKFIPADKSFTDIAPALLEQKAQAIGDRDKKRQSLFGDSDEGRFSKTDLSLNETLPAQQDVFRREANATQNQLSDAVGKIGDLNKQRATLDKQIQQAQLQVDIDQNKGGLFKNPANKLTLLREAFSRAGAQQFPEEGDALSGSLDAIERNARKKLGLPATVEAGEHEADLRTLKSARADISANPELGQLTAVFIDAERKSVEFAQKRLELAQEETNLILSRAGKLRGSFNEGTVSGAQASFSTVSPELDKAFASAANAFNIVDQNSKQVDNQRSILQKTLDATKDPDSRKTIERALIDNDALGQQNLEQRKRATADNRNVQSERLRLQAVGDNSELIPFEQRLAGVNNQSIAGGALSSRITIQELQKKIELNDRAIPGLREGPFLPGQDQANQADIEDRKKQSAAARVGIIQQNLNDQQSAPRTAEASSQLNIALRNLGNSAVEEKQKHDELTASLVVASESLRLFQSTVGEAARAAALGKEGQLVSLSDQIGELSGQPGPLGNLNDEDKKQLKLASLNTQFNLTAEQSGAAVRATGGTFGLGIVPDQTRLSAAQQAKEGLSLQVQVTSAGKELGNLVDTFAAARAKLQQEINKLSFDLNGEAEPGATDDSATASSSSSSGAGGSSPKFGPFNPFLSDEYYQQQVNKNKEPSEFTIDGKPVTPLGVSTLKPLDELSNFRKDDDNNIQRAAELAAATSGASGNFTVNKNVGQKGREAAAELFRFGSNAREETVDNIYDESGTRAVQKPVKPQPLGADSPQGVIQAINALGNAIKSQFTSQSIVKLHPESIAGVQSAVANGTAEGFTK